MVVGGRRARALLLGASFFTLSVGLAQPVLAQSPTSQASKRAGATQGQRAVTPLDANAQLAGGSQALDEITVAVTKTEERAIDALAGVSVIDQNLLDQLQPKRPSDIFFTTPSVSFQDRGDDPGTAIAVRGLQDFGRVAVVVDGARQNFQRTGHNANGFFYIDPSIIADVDVVRGPTANIYGSGAIGGVVSLRTKDVEDVLRAGERWGVLSEGSVGTNNGRGNGATFVGARLNQNVDILFGGSYRTQGNYKSGNNDVVPNSANESGTGLAKLTIRPAEGHELKFGYIGMDSEYRTGQPTIPNTSEYQTRTTNQTATASWRYAQPDDQLFDFKISTYFNQTATEQRKTAGSANPITGAIGDTRLFKVDTLGFDAYNTSRFDFGSFSHAVTYGGDYFNDKVTVNDGTGAAAYTTPNGERSVGGGFVQLRSKHGGWFETINAVRYDSYSLEAGPFSTSGERLSPKSTIGITPAEWMTVYGTYAEGYRAPSVTETLVSGNHPGVGVNGPSTQFGSLFTLLPNPGLRPEVGKNKEVGMNFRFNDVFTTGDKLRAKVNVFRNDVSDYIEMVSFGPRTPMVSICPVAGLCPPIPWIPVSFNATSLAQYQNVTSARIDGVELESSYDAGSWFGGVSGSWMKGYNNETGASLVSVPGQTIATTVGARFFDRKLTASVRWANVQSQKNLPVSYLPSGSRNVVNLFIGYQPTPDVLASFSIDNLLNDYYIPFATLRSNDGTDSALAGAAPGRVYRLSLKYRFGGA